MPLTHSIARETYLIDGQECTADEAKSRCSGSLGKREQVVLSMVLNPEDNTRIVDLGCLYGSFCQALLRAFPKSIIIAGDYDEEHLKIARLVYPETTNHLQILNAYDLNLTSSSVDILTFQEVIEHLEGAAQAIKEINRRQLTIGGIFGMLSNSKLFENILRRIFRFLIQSIFKNTNGIGIFIVGHLQPYIPS
jgi:ubiquinone/menaquinone biosynthesis C-methylase UbiE